MRELHSPFFQSDVPNKVSGLIFFFLKHPYISTLPIYPNVYKVTSFLFPGISRLSIYTMWMLLDIWCHSQVHSGAFLFSVLKLDGIKGVREMAPCIKVLATKPEYNPQRTNLSSDSYTHRPILRHTQIHIDNRHTHTNARAHTETHKSINKCDF